MTKEDEGQNVEIIAIMMLFEIGMNCDLKLSGII